MNGPRHRHVCYLGLGSNQNNPVQQIRTAINHLANQPEITLMRVASWYRSAAWGVTNQPEFINTAIGISTSLTPLALLRRIKIIEYRLMHRQVNQKWHERNIDIDILLYDRLTYQRPQLHIPHPLLAQRDFVVTPLMELSPQLPANLLQAIAAQQNINPSHDPLQKLRIQF